MNETTDNNATIRKINPKTIIVFLLWSFPYDLLAMALLYYDIIVQFVFILYDISMFVE